MLILPAIDLRGGRCVRLLRGEFDAQTEYSDDPLAVARDYERYGCPWLHVVDLDGAQTGEQANLAVIARIVTETGLSVQIGGGIRSEERARELLDLGAARIVVGSLAVTEPATIRRWFDEFGAGSLVLAFDVRFDDSGTALVTTHGWQRTARLALDAAIEGYLDTGLEHVLCTDISRDGAMSGPNTALYAALRARFPTLSIQASGGIRDAADLERLAACGATAAITGKAMLEGRIGPEEIRPFLPAG